MKYVDEFRDPARARRLAEQIHAVAQDAGRAFTIMEICGGQTHTIARYGLERLLPDEVTLIHGPGCPVCVTPMDLVDAARTLALDPAVTLCSFGDMLRVPGRDGDLIDARARGGDVRVVLSPLEAVRLAQAHPDRRVVFFAVGFETTAPLTAMAVLTAESLGLTNFGVLVGHVRVPPAIDALLRLDDVRIDGFLAAGHVCTVEGTANYPALADAHRVPIVVTGFEPVDILRGTLRCVEALAAGEAGVHNCYARSVRPEGNPHAREAVARVFEVADGPFRGLGVVPDGVLRLREAYARFDASVGLAPVRDASPEDRCRAAEVLTGRLRPDRCPEFGRACTPERPLGAPMVSSEGACAAYHRYRRVAGPEAS